MASDTTSKMNDVTADMEATQIDGQGPSKNALKKAAKQEKAAAGKAAKKAGEPTGKAESKKPAAKAPKKKAEEDEKKITVRKEEDFPAWYQQVLTKGDMLDYYDISGCYILKVYSSTRRRNDAETRSRDHTSYGKKSSRGSTRRSRASVSRIAHSPCSCRRIL
jgi:hypothetical protein